MWIVIWSLFMASFQEPVPQPAALESVAVPSRTITAQAWLFATYPGLARTPLRVETIGDAFHQRFDVSEVSGSDDPAATTVRPVLCSDGRPARRQPVERRSSSIGAEIAVGSSCRPFYG
jgi:hypothetical protein